MESSKIRAFLYIVTTTTHLAYMGAVAEVCSPSCDGRGGGVIAMGIITALCSLGLAALSILDRLQIELIVGGLTAIFSTAGVAVITSPETIPLSLLHLPIIAWLGYIALLGGVFLAWSEMSGDGSSGSTGQKGYSAVQTSSSTGAPPAQIPVPQPGAYVPPPAPPVVPAAPAAQVPPAAPIPPAAAVPSA